MRANQGDASKLKVRKRVVTFGDSAIDSPLLSGNLTALGRRQGELISCPVTGYFHLNPTEAVNLNLIGLQSEDHIAALTSRSESNPHRSLDGKENVLSEVVDQGTYDAAEYEYFVAVTEGIREELSRAYRLAQGGLEACEEGLLPFCPFGRLSGDSPPLSEGNRNLLGVLR